MFWGVPRGALGMRSSASVCSAMFGFRVRLAKVPNCLTRPPELYRPAAPRAAFASRPLAGGQPERKRLARVCRSESPQNTHWSSSAGRLSARPPSPQNRC
eukprot:10485878-Alexandrium_andersonii.AAC.1